MQLNDLFYVVPGYIVAGIVWSLVRWKLRCNRKAKEFKALTTVTDMDKNRIMRALDPANHREKITGWAAAWPMSMLVYFFRDVFTFFDYLIERYLKGAYKRIGADTLKDIQNSE